MQVSSSAADEALAALAGMGMARFEGGSWSAGPELAQAWGQGAGLAHVRLFWDMMRLRDAVAAVEGLCLLIGAVDDMTDGLWDVSDQLLREALSEIGRRRADAGAGGVPDPDRLLDDARDRYRQAVGDRAGAADPDLPAMAMALAQTIAQE